MTLKNSSSDNFFKSQRRLFGRRMACLVISCLVWFFTFPVGSALILLTNGSENADTAEFLSRMMGMRSWTFAFTLASAFVLAIQGISWLFSRQKVDFYESLPGKRAGRFRAVWVNSFLIWLLPFALFGLGTLVWLCGAKILTPTAFADLGAGLLRQSLLFMTTYAMTTAFGLLTGNAVSAVLLSFVFNLYMPVLILLENGLKTDFFATWSYQSAGRFPVLAGYLIPVSNYYSFGGDFEGQTTALLLRVMVRKALAGDLRNLVLFALFTLFAFWLYKRRKNEMSEVTLAFGPSVPIIMILLLVPGMILVGLMIHTMLQGFTHVVFAVCLLIMALVGMSANCLIEAYIEGDIRFAFRRFWAFAAALVLAAGIFGAFFYDVFGYDRFIPAEDQLQGIVLMPDGRRNAWSVNALEEYDPATYPVPLVTDLQTGRELARISQENQVRAAKGAGTLGGWSADLSYIGKNGRIDTRRVLIPKDIDKDLMDTLFQDRAFRRQIYPALDMDTALTTDLIWNSAWEEGGKSISETAAAPALAKRILEAYEKDLDGLSFEQIAEGTLAGTLDLFYRTDGTADGFDSCCIPVYEDCSNTMAILEECGVRAALPSLEADQIRYVEITWYGEEEMTRTYTEPDQIRAVTESLSGINTFYEIPFTPLSETSLLSVMIYWKDGREELDGCDYRMDLKKCPDFVKSDFETVLDW